VIGYRRLRPVGTRALTRAEVARILGLPVALREKTLWTLAYQSAAARASCSAWTWASWTWPTGAAW